MIGFLPRCLCLPKLVLPVVLIGALCLAAPVKAEDQAPLPYDQLMASPGAVSTVRSFALLVLATPHQRANIETRVRSIWWASNPELELGDAEYELAMSELVTQFDDVERVAGKHKLRKLDLMGFSRVGTRRSLDLYYAADSNVGPILFRLSVSFREGQQPLLHEVKVFEGFKAARTALEQVQFFAGNRVASYAITPRGEEAEQAGEDADAEG